MIYQNHIIGNYTNKSFNDHWPKYYEKSIWIIRHHL